MRTITAELIEKTAITGYEAYRGYRIAMGEFFQTSWQITPEETKQLYRVAALRVLEQPDAAVEEIHDAWCERMRVEGWSCGSEYNSAAKTHPWVIAFKELNPQMRLQYRIFKKITEAFQEEFLGQQELALK